MKTQWLKQDLQYRGSRLHRLRLIQFVLQDVLWLHHTPDCPLAEYRGRDGSHLCVLWLHEPNGGQPAAGAQCTGISDGIRTDKKNSSGNSQH